MRRARSTAVRRVGGMGVLALVAALAMTACSDESEESTDTASDSSESSASTEGSDDSPESDESQEEGSRDEGSGGGQATAGDAVAVWVTAIVEDQPVDACLAMGTVGDDGTAVANTAEMCEGEGPEAEQARQGVSALRESFLPENPGVPPVVAAAEGTESEGTTTFGGDQITVDGQTLQDIVVSNSTGVEAGQIGIEVETAEIDGLWYVTDMGLSLG
ncbi:hypothetical protein [Streptomyces hainanensis]|uniref:Secreted protein n=1 Tax=Streptomyces hainanensis TaxID=402648 RepID=A0A4R4TIB2_9ACTN|nr:hypothetical protein [Streptomyces hainanensis]TDC74039.1 hypothetical protein E1283_17180 [Streptomyces hainanensis]